MDIPKEFWSVETDDLLRGLETKPDGLSEAEAARRLEEVGENRLRPRAKTGALVLLVRQVRSPIILVLLGAAVLSFFLHDRTDATIIVIIVGVSAALGFWQERGATRAVERLLEAVEVRAPVLRDGRQRDVPIAEIVPGDVVQLTAGAVVPADARLLQARDLFVNESALTGETFPAEKQVGVLPADTPLARRVNAVFLGTHVVSGEGRLVVARTGAATEFGEISRRLRPQPPVTEFERGIRRFGYFLLTVTLVLVVSIFGVNIVLHRPLLQSFLFSLALAVGLTPQLLPAIITVNLAHGARDMARRRVIVKRLVSIENFGSMNVLCSDKTGTLTEGILHVAQAVDVDGRDSERVLFLAYLNASLESGYANPLDQAIRKHKQFDITGYRKLDEIPYDFTRKRLSVLVEHDGRSLMVTKGAVGGVLDVCTTVERPASPAPGGGPGAERPAVTGPPAGATEDVGPAPPGSPAGGTQAIGAARPAVEERVAALGDEGYRTLAVAVRDLGDAREVDRSDEAGLTFVGLLAVADPPKADAGEAIRRLAELGVGLKVISGDSAAVVRHVARAVGFAETDLLTGPEVRKISDAELPARLAPIETFAEVEPDQKERIITALKKAGNAVGYLGDGINDAPALHAADVGISVDSAVDVAKGAADIVLLDKDLDILADGVEEGRRTFANTLKYVFMATSANFGNMFSMAGASLFLPFLPLLPSQILVMNLMTDFPELAIASDSVDPELVERPRRWDIRFIRRFMVVFGLLSSVFDYVTFGVLLLLLGAGTIEFRTGWFVESVASAATIVLVIRTRRPFFRSKPGRLLRLATALVVAAVVAIPYTPVARPLGFTPLPVLFLAALAGVLLLYVAGAELVKRRFYRRYGGPAQTGPSAAP